MTSAAAQSQALWGENLRLCMFSCVFFAVCVCAYFICVYAWETDLADEERPQRSAKVYFARVLGPYCCETRWPTLFFCVSLWKCACLCVCFEYLNAFFSVWVSAHMFLSVVIHFKSLCTPVHLSVCVFVGSSMCSPTGSLWEASGQ